MITDQRISYYYRAAGHLADKVGRYDEAWEYFVTANRLAGAEWDPDKHSRYVDRLLTVLTPEFFARPGGSDSLLPVFVVGMPRSGTTLIEAVIDAHPRARGAGELSMIEAISKTLVKRAGGETPYPEVMDLFQGTDKRLGAGVWEGYARTYIEYLKPRPSELRIVNKQPLDFLHIGLIRRMFPAARIIHARRNPADCLLSCFFQNFTSGQEYTFNADHLGRFWDDYERFMGAVPVKVLDVVYEDMVADLEGQARRILDFLGLAWDRKVLEYYKSRRAVTSASKWQVRRPVYSSSVGRWRNYEEFMEGVLI